MQLGVHVPPIAFVVIVVKADGHVWEMSNAGAGGRRGRAGGAGVFVQFRMRPRRITGLGWPGVRAGGLRAPTPEPLLQLAPAPSAIRIRVRWA